MWVIRVVGVSGVGAGREGDVRGRGGDAAHRGGSFLAPFAAASHATTNHAR